MRNVLIIAAIVLTGILAWWLLPRKPAKADVQPVIELFRQSTADFQHSLDLLSHRLGELSDNPASVEAARESLVKCRLDYKRIAYFIAYFFPDQAQIFNGPPVPEIEPGMNEYRDPSGMQVIEADLSAIHPATNKKALVEQADLLRRSTHNLLLLMPGFQTSADELWYAMSLEFVRVYTLYITGYDAPQLKTGITEAAASLAAIDSTAYMLHEKSTLHDTLKQAMRYLLSHADFNHFNRLDFITRYALPIQRLINAHISSSPVNVSAVSAINFKASSLFAPDGLVRDFFPGSADTGLIALGKQLFSDVKLSGSNNRSCATCHSPAMFFSDRMRRNKNQEMTGDLPRNTPSLLYAAYQWHQFWDGRVRTLADQAIAVMNDTLEMKGAGNDFSAQLNNNGHYRKQFASIWKTDTPVTEAHVAMALAAFVRTLAPFRSRFDRYIAGEKMALSPAQQRGFNLFMGKGLCGTCHFAPLFNGLLPPLYNTTEFEVLGTPVDDNFRSAHLDPDTGRARIIASLPKGAFKTPTVRNAAATAPYMHNGGFATLEKVIDFYDKGGGQGLGLHVAGQTLLPEPLHLDSSERADLRAFIESLTDD